MKKYVLIGAFGFFGALGRVLVKSLAFMSVQRFPVGTLAVNLAGSFAFAVVVTAAYESGRISPELRLGLTAGFLGAFTTFSTFCKDTVGLLSAGHLSAALLYFSLSLLLGILAVYAGTLLVQHILLKSSGGRAPRSEKKPTSRAPASSHAENSRTERQAID